MLGRKRRGLSSIYLFCYLVLMTLFCSLAVDFGRIQLAKLELQRGADAAARAAAGELPNGTAAARDAAKKFAGYNKADGIDIEIRDEDVVFLKYDKNTNTYKPNTGSPDTVRVFARRIGDRSNGVPLLWAGVIGQTKSLNVVAKAAARYIPPEEITNTVHATANPFLAGTPQGEERSGSSYHPHVANGSGIPDYANKPGYTSISGNKVNSMPPTLGLPVSSGATYTFDSISGTARHDPRLADYAPDGQLNDIGHNNLTGSNSNSYTQTFMNENGIADMRAPINALVGVFLDNSDPADTDAPSLDSEADLQNCPRDFSSSDARNRLSYRPALKQVFFIGDGLTADQIRQQFIAPEGATRLYLATWDFYEWNNNSGNRVTKITLKGRIVTVE